MNTRLSCYHLSHIDLDGYSCQLITKQIFEKIFYYNANYGAEVMYHLEAILEHIDKAKEDASILITDLNLSYKESEFLDKAIRKRKEQGLKIELQLLDHHGSGQDSADAFSWYYLDTSRSATKITYDYACEKLGLASEDQKWLEPFVNIVNAVDLWLMDEEENFEYGKVCMRLITETRELNRYIFNEESHNYKLTLLKEAARMAKEPDAPIRLDDAIHSMKKNFFKGKQDGTLDALATQYIVSLVGKYKERFTIYYQGHKGILTYALGNTSIIGNGILKAYPEFDFVIDVGPRGSMSLRADHNIDVSKMAKTLAGGGGHPNASGARIKDFKEQFSYEKVKAFMEELIAKKS